MDGEEEGSHEQIMKKKEVKDNVTEEEAKSNSVQSNPSNTELEEADDNVAYNKAVL